MNLHGIVAGYVGSVNPQIPVSIAVSVGQGATLPDGTRPPAYATPGSVTASIGGTVTASANGTTLTVTAVAEGTLQPGDYVSATDVDDNALPAGCVIVEQISGSGGGVGVYELSAGTSSGVLLSCTVTSVGDTLNVTAVGAGKLQVGQTLADITGDLVAGTLITGQLSGANGGPGTYSLNQQQSVPPEAMTTSLVLLGQVQPLSGADLRQIEGLNLQGSMKAIYVNGRLAGGVRVELKGGDVVTLPDRTAWLVTKMLEPWNVTAGWTKALLTLQNTTDPAYPPAPPPSGLSTDLTNPANVPVQPAVLTGI